MPKGSHEVEQLESEPLQLRIDEEDFDAAVTKAVKAGRSGTRTLAGTDRDPEEILMDAMPSAVAKKVRAIVPKGFELTELQLKLEVSGTVFGTGMKGEVMIKLAPKR
jgi:hypothetical protein